jgi:hypothetical protein
MTPLRAHSALRHLPRGQALVEYAVVGGVLAAALFVLEWDGRTAAQFLADAVRAFFQNMTYYLSLP